MHMQTNCIHLIPLFALAIRGIYAVVRMQTNSITLFTSIYYISPHTKRK
ncbi:hypothetical protein BN1326_50109 [Staphylococcus argenteus]|uniref:Uncharacterized protein n=1 Tax=Staphylococcus argenteus TaxID=985002 RepID=A0A7U7JSZ3_9STAP|nr:hypothetical protein BN1326_50109 [Staphylococcus argenteus]CRI23223.1 hypothetical protein BN1326_50109 [Staphylococcus argenteus]